MNDTRTSSSTETAIALCLGGLDPSGGAGLLRDATVLAALGIHAMAIPVAETTQNGLACQRIEAPCVDPAKRLESLAPHLRGAWGVKLGMCALEPRDLSILLERLDGLRPSARIWDPILAPSMGVGLHDAARLRNLADLVLGTGSWVVSPNLPEACAISGLEWTSGEQPGPADLARPLLERGAGAVWLKGGHGEGPWVEDFWIDGKGVRSLGRHRRLEGERRGTGCFLASAWLGLRLKGLDEFDAAQGAAKLIRQAWKHSVLPGGVGRPCLAPEAR